MIARKIIPEIAELVLFGLVGISATAVHYIVAVLGFMHFGVPVWFANIIAFVIALPVSYFGHAFLTFSAKRYGRISHVTRTSALRFFLLAFAGFSINETSVIAMTYYFEVPPRLGILVTLVFVAGLLFLLSKLWAYRGDASAQAEGN